MTDEDIERIYRISSDKISETSLALKRYAYNDINWDCRLIGLRGARGVGKTTLLLQKILESGVERDMSLYLSLDNLSSPEKIYCENTNLMYALTPDADIGTAREAFFANQVSNGHVLTYPKKGDFLVDDRWLFEIGGKGKGFAQIKDVPDSYVVNDGVEVGIGNKIPLWLFGFLY